MARCFRCGIDDETNRWVGFEGETCGELCYNHYEQFQYDIEECSSILNRELEYCDSDYENYYHSKFHDESVGNYDHRCEKCDGKFYSREEYDYGLCPWCSEKVIDAKNSDGRKKYNAYRKYYYNLRSIFSRNGLKAEAIDYKISENDRCNG